MPGQAGHDEKGLEKELEKGLEKGLEKELEKEQEIANRKRKSWRKERNGVNEI